MQIGVKDVGNVLAQMTRELEMQEGALGRLILSRNRFERWWQQSIFLKFTHKPWNRAPGYEIHEGAGVAIESTWPVCDPRSSFTRQTSKDQKRIDLIVRKAPTGFTSHLIELKILDRNNEMAATITGIHNDILALRAILEWGDVASCWSAVLAHSFESSTEVRDALSQAIPKQVRVDRPQFFPIRRHSEGSKMWMVGIRIRL